MRNPVIKSHEYVLAVCLLAVPWNSALSDAPRPRVANNSRANDSASQRPAKESPVETVLRWGELMLEQADQIEDYSCTFVKRERISGKLGEQQVYQARIRHRPFSVYLKCQSPRSMIGREALWVEGRNNGKLLANGTGVQSILGTVSLDPNGYFAMQDNLHPITDIGIRNLIEKMIATTKHDARISQINIVFRRNAKVRDRVCTCVEFDHPIPKPGLRYRLSRIYIDNEWSIPIRFEGYTWPRQRGGDPILLEEYTYTDLKVNTGLTAEDFRL